MEGANRGRRGGGEGRSFEQGRLDCNWAAPGRSGKGTEVPFARLGGWWQRPARPESENDRRAVAMDRRDHNSPAELKQKNHARDVQHGAEADAFPGPLRLLKKPGHQLATWRPVECSAAILGSRLVLRTSASEASTSGSVLRNSWFN